ncbi:MAG: DUF4294 domain-containing protein [Bacteroidales bacterium]|jgi:hypothetical protein|nr:DUF4294 domain-containing protein [Bacteroidales bacterium]MDZ4059363.1 DUF4294 domain-containing protein [Bacteroidales bacterium]
MRNSLLYILSSVTLLLISINLFSQERGYTVGYKIEGRDTIYYINMPEAYLFSWDKSKKKGREWREFYRLVYNFKKTYPYALIARDKVIEADSILLASKFNSRERERFIKQFETNLFNEFEKPLRKMTFSQGRLLLKLIDREIGQSSFYIIKNYRGGAAAGFWQGIAKIFGSDLKKPYDKFGDDRLTEELVVMYKRGTFDYLYYSIF